MTDNDNIGKFLCARTACHPAAVSSLSGKLQDVGPETEKNKLMWMVGEIREVMDIIKKNGDEKSPVLLP